MRNFRFLFLLFLVIPGCYPSVESENRKIADEMEKSFQTELLDVWYPMALDTVWGGYLCDFGYDWQPGLPQNKMIVTQARQVWTSSSAAMFFKNNKYQKIAEHGFHFIRDKMWDKEYEGFYMIRDRQGNPVGSSSGNSKTAYGNAFAIYALTTYFRLTGDSSALDLAQQTFRWLEKYSHDPEFGGYFNNLTREGELRYNILDTVARFDKAGPDWKDQNSSIHLLEAFSELYKVWPDSLLQLRLMEMLMLIRDTIVTEKGYLTLFLHRDWTPVSYRDSSDQIRRRNFSIDHVSFGHDIETAYLILEASEALESDPDSITLTIAKKMVDHSLQTGWDKEKGGLFYEGYYFRDSASISIIDKSKSWWVQAETLNSLLIMSELFPEEKRYYEDFLKQWKYMQTYLIDHQYGGWYPSGLDNDPEMAKANKASAWKVNYHESRALMNCILRLRGNE